MSVLVDTSVLIDVQRGEAAAGAILRDARLAGLLHASEVTRLEVLAGMRAAKERSTHALLAILDWHPVDAQVAGVASELGRRWLPSNRGIGFADLAIAATAMIRNVPLPTRDAKHFPMFSELSAPY